MASLREAMFPVCSGPAIEKVVHRIRKNLQLHTKMLNDDLAKLRADPKTTLTKLNPNFYVDFVHYDLNKLGALMAQLSAEIGFIQSQIALKGMESGPKMSKSDIQVWLNMKVNPKCAWPIVRV